MSDHENCSAQNGRTPWDDQIILIFPYCFRSKQPNRLSFNDVTNTRKEIPMSYRTFISIAAAAILGIACVSTEALARGGHARAVHAGGVHHGSVAHGAYVRRGAAVGVGAAAVGATRYYNTTACGYYPYPPCY
jgi:hypothetical protein